MAETLKLPSSTRFSRGAPTVTIPQWQRDLAVIHSKLASIFDLQGRIADTLRELGQGRDIMAALVAIAPGNAQRKGDLAWFEGQIARLRSQAQR
jgi:hypothetical protein